ncbi:hypothetical protein HS125_04140 [bacterium]|nr:hypothetical protein [bacterium]
MGEHRETSAPWAVPPEKIDEAVRRIVEAHGKALPERVGDVTRLTPFATVFRYDDLPLAAAVERVGLLPLVQRLRAFVEEQIGDIAP